MTISKKLRQSRGFTLVELMIVVVIIGILAALAIYGVSKYVANSKSAEARMALGRLGKDAAAAYEGQSMAGATLAFDGTVGTTRRLCGSAVAPVPAAMQGDGVKYQPRPTDWQTADPADPLDIGWSCLKFSMDSPIFFQYDYRVDAARDFMTASAQAPLEGGIKLIYMNAQVQAEGSAGTVLTMAPSLCEAQNTAATTNPLSADGTCSL